MADTTVTVLVDPSDGPGDPVDDSPTWDVPGGEDRPPEADQPAQPEPEPSPGTPTEEGIPEQPTGAAPPDSPGSDLPLTGIELSVLLLLAVVLVAAGLLMRSVGRRNRPQHQRGKS